MTKMLFDRTLKCKNYVLLCGLRRRIRVDRSLNHIYNKNNKITKYVTMKVPFGGIDMIGRDREIKELHDLYNSGRAELVAIYGRRRIGKTYLVDETFKNQITFRHAGLSPVEVSKTGMLRAQLEHFYYSLKLYGMKENKKPKTWLEAFYMLEKLLQEQKGSERKLIFLDELPWLDSPRSGFMTAFEAFWNTWACHRDDIMVVVCGSANSWILDKLINNHGGLYNRVTYEIKLSPFTLKECEEYYRSKNIRLSRYDIAQSYMIFGGIPYYMGYFQSRKSLAQNIDILFFEKQAKLADEYNRLFASIFSEPERIKAIVKLLYTRSAGYTRSEITERLGVEDGSRLSSHLNALISSDFVIKYVPFGRKMREHYKLTDPFCLFYLHFIDDKKHKLSGGWSVNASSQQVISWRGIAYENLCFNHIDQIKTALGINGISSSQSAWSKRSDDEEGTQIDMLIERRDNVVNMCEIKFFSEPFTVNKQYYLKLMHRLELLRSELSPKISVLSTLISTYGLKHNEYSGIFDNSIQLDDLFL